MASRGCALLAEEPALRWWCASGVCGLSSFVAVLVIMPVYGAQAFGNCSEQEKREDDDDCRFDYATWQLWWGLTLSVNNFLGYLMGSIVGRMGDRFGMTRLSGFQSIAGMMTMVPLLFGRENIWGFLVLFMLSLRTVHIDSMFISEGLLSSTHIPGSASVMRIVAEKDRTVALSTLGAAAYLGVVSGALCAAVAFRIRGIGGIPEVLCMMMFDFINVILMFGFAPELTSINVETDSNDDNLLTTMDDENNTNNNTNNDNNLSSLGTEELSEMSWFRRYLMMGECIVMCQLDGLISWICRSSAIYEFCNEGITTTAVTFYLDSSKINSEQRASLIGSMVSITISLVTVFSLGLFVPMFKKYYSNSDQIFHNNDDITLLLIGAVSMMISMILFFSTALGGLIGMVSLLLASIVFGATPLSHLAHQKLISDVIRDPAQTGQAVGVVAAWGALCDAFSPLCFSGLFWIGKKKLGQSWIFFIPGLMFCLLNIWIVYYPIRVGYEDIMRMKQPECGIAGFSSSKKSPTSQLTPLKLDTLP